MRKTKIWQTSWNILWATGRAIQLPRSQLYTLILINLVLGAVPLTQFFNRAIYTLLHGLVASLYSLVVMGICARGSSGIIKRVRAYKAQKFYGRSFCPLLLSMSTIFFAAAQFTLLCYFLFTRHDPFFPLLTYIFIFCIYPFIISAILLLPVRGISPLARLRIFLDSLIIMTVIVTLCYYFVLAPWLSGGGGSWLEKSVGVLFPTADLIILFCLLLVALRSGEPALHPVLGILGLGLFLIFLIHANRLYEIVSGVPHWTKLMGIAWAPVMMLLVAAVQMIKNMLQRDEAIGYTVDTPVELAGAFFSTNRWKLLLSLILVLAASLLVVALWLGGIKKTLHGEIAIIYIGGFIVLMLIVLRQLLAMYEVGVLQGKLQRRNRSLSLLRELLERQATTDPLTGLPNHQELLMKLKDTLGHSSQTLTPSAAIFMDLDYFKFINDCYGHPTGDTILCEFSELVLSELHEQDYLGRWGGEEFVAVLPGTKCVQALQIAERVRARVEQHLFASERRIRLTCSLGVASYSRDSTCCDELLMSADRAMYAAKRLGRNQARMASEPLVLAMSMFAEEPEVEEEAEMLAVVESFIVALEARDRLTGQHSRRVAALSLKLALALGQSRSDACITSMGGLLHDLGKVAMPDSILFKQGRLSAAEIEYMTRHPLIGQEILAPLPSLRPVAMIVRTHHEWVNGSGYPDGLRGEEIPLGARIVAVADAFDAIISHRVYRQGRAPSEATAELRRGAGKQFDPRVVETLDHLLTSVPCLMHSCNSL